jgi:hypothetical protein
MTSPQEIALMQSIRNKYHTEIEQACDGTGIPPEFIAALIANESGGDPTKKRSEKNVLAQLWEVLMGRSAAFGSIGRADIALWLPDSSPFRSNLQTIDDFATSWGLTQIMGYEIIPWGIVIAGLQTVPTSLRYTTKMLLDFAKRDSLSFSLNQSELFDCWNSGRPHAPTADPNYIPNGLARLALYRDLGEEPPDKAISA